MSTVGIGMYALYVTSEGYQAILRSKFHGPYPPLNRNRSWIRIQIEAFLTNDRGGAGRLEGGVLWRVVDGRIQIFIQIMTDPGGPKT
jgi:hypothetical protein